MATFERAIPVVLQHEGSDFTDDPADPGGATKYGITLNTLRIDMPGATVDDVRNLTRDDAVAIYRERYWTSLFDTLDQQVATKIFDARVNCGGLGIEFAQKAANILGHPCSVDGVFGPQTSAAVEASDPRAFLGEMGGLLGAHYSAWIAADPAREKFRAGLMRRAHWPDEVTEAV